mmetsp:Transcript_40758/g.65530  ORF Transcript_40758/g.65530 Transcript_40758/m.65530 type:complete len:226 (+) Transcript_40758:2042-2719(+)
MKRLHLTSSDTIGNLKGRIEAELGVPKARQKLMAKGVDTNNGNVSGSSSSPSSAVLQPDSLILGSLLRHGEIVTLSEKSQEEIKAELAAAKMVARRGNDNTDDSSSTKKKKKKKKQRRKNYKKQGNNELKLQDLVAPEEEEVEWACRSCTYHNVADASMCAVCNAPRPKGKGQRGVSTRWKCSVCTFINLVSGENASCEMCGAPRPAKPAPSNSSSRRRRRRNKK